MHVSVCYACVYTCMCKEDAKCKSKGRFGMGIGVCLDTGKKM